MIDTIINIYDSKMDGYNRISVSEVESGLRLQHEEKGDGLEGNGKYTMFDNIIIPTHMVGDVMKAMKACLEINKQGEQSENQDH